jgi:hypothetical protein
MTSVDAPEVRERVGRWIEEGQSLLGVLLGFLYEYERVLDLADAAQRECERLREDVNRLRAEADRYRSERDEIVESLSRCMNDLLARLRSQQP